MISIGLMILALALLTALFKRAGLFTILAVLGSAVLAGAYLDVLRSGSSLGWVLSLPGILGDADLLIDPLTSLFGLIFALGFPLGLIYGYYYLKDHPLPGTGSHLFFLGLMMLSMHGILMVRNSLLFMVGWELMSLSSFFAILYDREDPATRRNALYYLVMMHVGATFLLAGFGLLYRMSGTLNFGYQAFPFTVKWLLLIGFAFKAGFFPFYSWLPKAHPVAPAHLSGMMSGLMIKTGIFGLILVLSQSVLTLPEVLLLIAIALMTAFNGIIHAMAESNIKRSLAYSSIENIGIIGIGIGFWQLGHLLGNPTMATLGFCGAILHTFNHSLFKPMLFYLSGNVLLSTHSLLPDELGGLGKRMPVTGSLFLLGTLAISGIPLFNGFVSELAIFLAILSGYDPASLGGTMTGIVAGAIFAFVSALALIAFAKVYSISFSGAPRSDKAINATERRKGLLFSPVILAASCLILGVFGRIGLSLLTPLSPLFRLDTMTLLSLGNVLDSLSIVLLTLLIITGVVYLLKRRSTKVTVNNAWGCGYQGLSSRMQYTGAAFIDPLSYFLKPLMHRKSTKDEALGYFPQSMGYEEEVHDYLDSRIISRLCAGLRRFLALFDKVHNGRTNSYITYLLLALILLLFWVLGVSR